MKRTWARPILPLALLVGAACSSGGGARETIDRTAQAAGAYGNNHADIVWQDFPAGAINQGQVGLWYYYGGDTNNTWRGTLSNFVGAGWNVRLDGDFYGDGGSTLLLQSNDTGGTTANPDQRFILWHLKSGAVTDTPIIATGVPGEWTVVSALDIDGDNHDDIIWQNQVTGDLGVWFMNGSTSPVRVTVGHYQPSPKVHAIDAGRFDGITPAVLLYDETNQLMKSVSLISLGWQLVNAYPVSTIRSADPAWTEFGVGDANGDGKSDVYWFNPTTHQVGEWLMDGNISTSRVASYAFAGYGGAGWTPIQVGDYDANGRADVLWRNAATSEIVIWNMGVGGNGVTSGPSFGSPPCKWAVATLGTHGDVTLACATQGAPGQACYAGGTCDPGIECFYGVCMDPRQCGSLGTLCCDGTSCDGNSQCDSIPLPYGVTLPGFPPVCGPICGHDGQPACSNAVCNVPGMFHDLEPGPLQGQNVCDSKCSTIGHACCMDSKGVFTAPWCPGLTKQDASGTMMCEPLPPPTPCGKAGERCCGKYEANSACGTSDGSSYTTECISNLCVSCGREGEQCCGSGSPCWGDSPFQNDPSLHCGGNKVCYRGSTQTKGPDLAPGSTATTPAFAVADGSTFTVTWNDVNVGSAATGKYVDTVTVSPPNNGQPQTKTIDMSALGVGQASMEASFSFPTSASGEYMIHIQVNSGDVPESNFGNNTVDLYIDAQ